MIFMGQNFLSIYTDLSNQIFLLERNYRLSYSSDATSTSLQSIKSIVHLSYLSFEHYPTYYYMLEKNQSMGLVHVILCTFSILLIPLHNQHPLIDITFYHLGNSFVYILLPITLTSKLC